MNSYLLKVIGLMTLFSSVLSASIVSQRIDSYGEAIISHSGHTNPIHFSDGQMLFFGIAVITNEGGYQLFAENSSSGKMFFQADNVPLAVRTATTGEFYDFDQFFPTSGVFVNGAKAGLNYAFFDIDNNGSYETLIAMRFASNVNTLIDLMTNEAFNEVVYF